MLVIKRLLIIFEYILDNIRWFFQDRFTLAEVRFDLALFSAEDEGRTEDPSERKKKKARDEEGRVVNSAEMNQNIVFLVVILTIAILIPYYTVQISEFIVFNISLISQADTAISTQNIKNILAEILIIFIKIILPLMVVGFVFALLSNVAQTRFVFAINNIKPKLSKILPNWQNFKQRVFFSKQNMMNLFKILAKVSVISLITVLTIKKHYNSLLAFTQIDLLESVTILGEIILEMLIKVIAFMLAVSVADYIFQRKQYIESLKMTKHEVKEEVKEAEGDPYVKGRLRDMMNQIVFRNMYRAVEDASVVITNPTHFAVALKYEEGSMVAPVVVAKGADNVAFRIREIATDYGIEIIENKPLARELYYNIEIGEVIPQKLYKVVSEILSAVYRLGGNRNRTYTRNIG